MMQLLARVERPFFKGWTMLNKKALEEFTDI